MSEVKQVILVRRDLKMKPGKIASQVAHASMKVFFQYMEKTTTPPHVCSEQEMQYGAYWSMPNMPYFEEYITGSFKKIVVYVESEKELLDIYNIAVDNGMNCSLIKDSGLTVFDGVPTYTAVGIGPWDSKEIDEITGHLKLL